MSGYRYTTGTWLPATYRTNLEFIGFDCILIATLVFLAYTEGSNQLFITKDETLLPETHSQILLITRTKSHFAVTKITNHE